MPGSWPTNGAEQAIWPEKWDIKWDAETGLKFTEFWRDYAGVPPELGLKERYIRRMESLKEERVMPVEMDTMNIISDLQQVLRHSEKVPGWVVIVCPNSDITLQCGRLLAASLPNTATFSGRTALMEKDTRISVTQASEPVFVPDETPFTVAFLGWKAKDPNHGMLQWQSKASALLRMVS